MTALTSDCDSGPVTRRYGHERISEYLGQASALRSCRRLICRERPYLKSYLGISRITSHLFDAVEQGRIFGTGPASSNGFHRYGHQQRHLDHVRHVLAAYRSEVGERLLGTDLLDAVATTCAEIRETYGFLLANVGVEKVDEWSSGGEDGWGAQILAQLLLMAVGRSRLLVTTPTT